MEISAGQGKARQGKAHSARIIALYTYMIDAEMSDR